MINKQPTGLPMIVAQCVPYVLRESYTLNVLQSRIHGLDHWFRVWQTAVMLADRESSVDMEVVALYALFHDSMRMNDDKDPNHGLRGYKLWEQFNRLHDAKQFLTQAQQELIFEACTEHSNGSRSTDPTIAVCWDADRMDLFRKGIFPSVLYMSTQTAIDLRMRT